MPRPRQQRSGRPPGGSGRPPGSQHDPEVQTRRLIAVVVIVVVVIVLALLVKSCSSSQTTTALKNYNANVSTLIDESTATGQTVFSDLKSGDSGDLANQVQAANSQLSKAESFSVPSQMAGAQSYLVSAMKLRAQAISRIADWAPQAQSKSTSKDAVYNISVGTSELYGSDLLYKTFVVADIAKALNGDGIPIGTSAGEQQINGAQVVHDLGWLQSAWIADTIGAQMSTAQANQNNDQPGLHGHSLNGVTVGGVTLSQTSTNTIPVSNARTWVLSVTNGGNFNEFDVGCSITIAGLSDTGTGTIAETFAGQPASCTVHLPSAPESGTYSVTARIAAVPGETNLTNNVITYSVQFN